MGDYSKHWCKYSNDIHQGVEIVEYSDNAFLIRDTIDFHEIEGIIYCPYCGEQLIRDVL